MKNIKIIILIWTSKCNTQVALATVRVRTQRQRATSKAQCLIPKTSRKILGIRNCWTSVKAAKSSWCRSNRILFTIVADKMKNPHAASASRLSVVCSLQQYSTWCGSGAHLDMQSEILLDLGHHALTAVWSLHLPSCTSLSSCHCLLTLCFKCSGFAMTAIKFVAACSGATEFRWPSW